MLQRSQLLFLWLMANALVPLGALRSPILESPSPPTDRHCDRGKWMGAQVRGCLTAAMLATIPAISAVSGLLWKFSLPGEGLRALLGGELRRKWKCKWLKVKQHWPWRLPPDCYLLGQSRPHTLKSGLIDCVFCLWRNVCYGMTNTTSKPSTAEMSSKSLPHRTCDYHKRAPLTCLIFNW